MHWLNVRCWQTGWQWIASNGQQRMGLCYQLYPIAMSHSCEGRNYMTIYFSNMVLWPWSPPLNVMVLVRSSWSDMTYHDSKGASFWNGTRTLLSNGPPRLSCYFPNIILLWKSHSPQIINQMAMTSLYCSKYSNIQYIFMWHLRSLRLPQPCFALQKFATYLYSFSSWCVL